MLIRVFSSSAEVARGVATRIAEFIRERPEAVLALPTGRTPVLAYEELGAMAHGGAADFSRARFFGIDEFVGLSREHPGSFRAYLQRHLFTPLQVPPDRIHLLNGHAADLDAESAAYEDAIEAAGGLDLVMLGIGANGHIGFNEPGDALNARTHRVTLHMATRRDNAAAFGKTSDVPREAISMGMGTLLKAGTVMLVATGREKATCIERSVSGAVTPRVPASFLQLHRRVELYLDREAASLLRPELCAFA
jgi:glucosamine-6-phosphate deaminase